MKNCPNCGALIGDGQTSCSICNTPIVEENINNNTNEGKESKFFFNQTVDESVPIGKIYEPLPSYTNEENNTENKINNTDSKDEEKKNVMSNILKEHEEKKVEQKNNDTLKASLLSIFVVIITVVGGIVAVKLGFDNISDGKDHIINSVVNQANSYTTIVKNYMKKFDYKYNTTSLNGYYAKSRTFNFLSIPLTSKCVFMEGKWTGADNDEVSCEKFFNDINSNYCQAVPCDVPSSAEIYLKETYETIDINGTEETITTGTFLDGTTLTYDDVTCTLSNNNYTCQYIEKQDE